MVLSNVEPPDMKWRVVASSKNLFILLSYFCKRYKIKLFLHFCESLAKSKIKRLGNERFILIPLPTKTISHGVTLNGGEVTEGYCSIAATRYKVLH